MPGGGCFPAATARRAAHWQATAAPASRAMSQSKWRWSTTCWQPSVPMPRSNACDRSARSCSARSGEGQPPKALTTWLTDLHEDEQAERLPRGSVAVISARRTPQGLEPAIHGLRHALEREAASFSALSTALEFSSSRRFGASADEASQPFSMRRELLEEWRDNLPRLAEMTALNVSAARCASEEMAPLAAVAESWPEAGRNLAALLDATRYRALIDTAFRERPALATFDGDSHAGVVARFRQLDALQIEYNRAALAQQHWNAMPQVDAGGQLGVLRREFQKRARHLPVRQLVQRAGAAIQAIKPVFMMSPLSIATYLPAGAVQFDLVVFDEASQVRPVDAFGALLRGKQAVVVGDEKQLPPTSFFDSLTEADGADEDALITSDYQSVLELFLAQSAPKRMLRWHYRSRHQSLIAVSNQEFYENKLVVFPSPSDTTAGAGLVFHHLPQTAYERGGSRTNPQEAAIVARAVMQHAAEHPELTLGVASFSISQTNAIRDELERLRREDPSSEAFFAAHPHEPFFVKNLENVQGDERDVIFISVGYGRNANGYLSMHFGPLNDAGGERRLNVLITRARLRCEVFSNITDDDLDLERSPAAGVRALKQFLRYARTGLLDLPEASGRPAGSPFETAVEQALLRAGYQVHRQVGSAGFFIDLAIVDPQRPGRYLLGIECDGASYHSARSARDRDRLRQLVLERLGWTIYRIWSVDWFRDPDGELRHVVAAIEAARAGGAPSLVSGASAATSIARAETGNGPVSRSLPSYRMAHLRLNTRGRQLPDIDPDILADWVSTVVATESPVHAEEVIRRICTAAGAGRVGARIHSALSYAIALAAARERIVIRGAFLWLPGMTTPQPRDRAALDSTARDLALVAPEEIDLVVEMVVRDAVAIDPEQVAPAVARLFGFQRLTDTMRAEIDPRIRTLLATGRLVEHNGQLRPATQVDTTGGMR
ncbi:MAG: hypothetical protein DCC58_17975 [Chloroflexi bacterium]|nr:MAG: hypothetical protein DCC58_17975 [Chloroflexota bacterium]